MRSAKSMEWIANDTSTMCIVYARDTHSLTISPSHSFSLSISLTLTLTLSCVRSFQMSLSLTVVGKKRISHSRHAFFLSIAKYVFLPYSCHTLTHSLTHYLRRSSGRTFELSTISICHFDVKKTSTNTQMTSERARGERWTSKTVSQIVDSKKKKETFQTYNTTDESQAQEWISDQMNMNMCNGLWSNRPGPAIPSHPIHFKPFSLYLSHVACVCARCGFLFSNCNSISILQSILCVFSNDFCSSVRSASAASHLHFCNDRPENHKRVCARALIKPRLAAPKLYNTSIN